MVFFDQERFRNIWQFTVEIIIKFLIEKLSLTCHSNLKYNRARAPPHLHHQIPKRCENSTILKMYSKRPVNKLQLVSRKFLKPRSEKSPTNGNSKFSPQRPHHRHHDFSSSYFFDSEPPCLWASCS